MTANQQESLMDSKVKKYEEFLNEKLKADLRSVHEQRDKLYQTISEYIQLKRIIETIKTQQIDKTDIKGKSNNVKTKIDLGCNFYCQAIIPDCSRVYVLVGYGYYVEMTLNEAEIFIDKKIQTLTLKGQQFTKDSAKIKAHIRLVMEGLREIQSLNVATEKPHRNIFV